MKKLDRTSPADSDSLILCAILRPQVRVSSSYASAPSSPIRWEACSIMSPKMELSMAPDSTSSLAYSQSTHCEVLCLSQGRLPDSLISRSRTSAQRLRVCPWSPESTLSCTMSAMAALIASSTLPSNCPSSSLASRWASSNSATRASTARSILWTPSKPVKDLSFISRSRLSFLRASTMALRSGLDTTCSAPKSGPHLHRTLAVRSQAILMRSPSSAAASPFFQLTKAAA